ncbi:MAG: hypothetical protein QOD00_1868 [Blastocatellia bacterium]|jgi:hypothetical protein|nr:hypothetical protein [Blastocatellia bacterium]
MNGLLIIFSILLCAGICVFVPVYGAPAVIMCVPLALLAALMISQAKGHAQFLLRLFAGGLLVRILVGTLIFITHKQDFFGTDAASYDFYGYLMISIKETDSYYRSVLSSFMGGGAGSAWGMVYLVAGIYSLVGRNTLATQLVNSIIGAATAPVIFLCAQHIYKNLRVARIAGLFVAFFPSLVLWSAQGLKDGPIVFLLSLSMLATLKLGERFNVKYFIILVGALFGILSLRFYIFYILLAAIAGAFVIGLRSFTASSFMRQFIVMIGITLALAYLGVTRYATSQIENFDLQRVQQSRSDLAQSAASGFGKDTDVSTTSGALTAIPVGMIYLLFAPFPWQLASLRQSITMPEMLVWWASFPALVLGLWFTIKYYLRQASPILIFSAMLTVAYSVFQGNVGTAYRQRSQLLVFYFIFVAVGYVLLREKREDRQRQQELTARQELAARQAARRQPRHVNLWDDEKPVEEPRDAP